MRLKLRTTLTSRCSCLQSWFYVSKFFFSCPLSRRPSHSRKCGVQDHLLISEAQTIFLPPSTDPGHETVQLV